MIWNTGNRAATRANSASAARRSTGGGATFPSRMGVGFCEPLTPGRITREIGDSPAGPVACRCARLIEGSTATTQSRSAAASASAHTSVSSRSHVPSPDHRSWPSTTLSMSRTPRACPATASRFETAGRCPPPPFDDRPDDRLVAPLSWAATARFEARISSESAPLCVTGRSPTEPELEIRETRPALVSTGRVWPAIASGYPGLPAPATQRARRGGGWPAGPGPEAVGGGRRRAVRCSARWGGVGRSHAQR